MATIPTQSPAANQTAKPASTSATKKSAPGLAFSRHFSKPGVSPYDEIVWERRDAVIQDWKGNLIFEQKNVEVPTEWSVTATNIVASKYLHGLNGTQEREDGVRALITRVAESIRDWGIRDGYFASDDDAAIFYAELAHLLLNQKVAFNSPVWFNVGCDRLEPNSDAQNWHWNPHSCAVEFSVTGYSKPQCSACFINSVQDSLDSILTLAKTEGMLFKWGSGAGSNLSSIRGSMETLSGGGTASGPLSFMRGFDAFAGVIKSGGKTRRAAKMVVLNIDHPDIEDFIECKVKEEEKAWHLVQAGYDGSGPDSEAYSSIFFQNANNSVRVTDEFMQAVESDGPFATRTVKEKNVVKEYKARDLMHKIAEATWQCGDPGMQYDTTINRWHTSKNTARINASNPCSEYMFLDDSACNLASFNLLKFLTPGGQFDVASYRHAIAIVTTAMEIIVDSAGYPTEMIAKNSHDYRPLGLGYANLGALLMAFGLPYDSDAGRDFAGTLTAILCGDAYWQSSRIAETCAPLGAATPLTKSASIDGGACPGFYVNREPFLDVIRMHRAEVNNIGKSRTSAEPFVAPQLTELVAAAKNSWDGALAHGEKFGYRNSQVTVLAPTGTIGFMMDCDTTGVEPDLALVKYKKLVGGGMIKIVNNTVPSALIKLGYSEADVNAIVSYIDATGTIEGAPAIKPEHLAVFDCSFKPAKGTRSISYMGHIKMMGAAQPFLSGAISKTVNLPQDCSVDDIAEAYMESWRQGIKAVAIYRDNSKGTQPLNVSAQTDDNKKGTKATNKPTPAASAEKDGVILSEAKDPATLYVTTTAGNLSATEAASRLDAQHARITALEAQIRAIAEAALLNADAADSKAPPRAVRHRLPAERASVTHKFGLVRSRRLHHRRPLPQRLPRRDLHPHGQGGLHRLRPDGFLRHRHLARPATRRAAEGALRKVRPHPLRALRLDRQPRDRLRQIDHGLHLPLDPDPFPLRHPARPLRRPPTPRVGARPRPGHRPSEHGQPERIHPGGFVVLRHSGVRRPHPTPARHRPRPRRPQRPDGERSTVNGQHALRRPWHLPHRLRHALHDRHGRQPQLRHLRSHHDPQRLLLPLQRMRQHQRL